MSSGSVRRRHLAAIQFHRARRQAAIERLVARLSGNSADLLSYEAVVDKLRIRGQSTSGIQQIPISAIVGSVGRYQDFTRTFLPRLESDEERWVAVSAAAPVVGDLPPIEVYKIGDAYFVLDGNHRVSVARQQRVAYIDAYVTEVRTRVPLPPGAKPDDWIIAAEYAAFLEYTRLDLTHPDLDLRVSVPGQYAHLENHIEAFRYRLEAESGQDVALVDAAARWHDKAYLPLVLSIRDQGVLRYFPGRTETDFFVWLSRHRIDLERELGLAIGADDAVARLLPRAQATERATTTPHSPWRRLRQLVAPERKPSPPATWAAERTLARYSERLFANILFPLALDEAAAQAALPEAALNRALALTTAEEGHLRVLAVAGHDPPTPTEQAGIDALQSFVREHQERRSDSVSFELATGDPAQRVLRLAFLHDLIVLDRHFNRSAPDEPAPTGAVRRIIAEAHRPIFLVEASERPGQIGRALLVHDTRRTFDEALFIGAYLAERWGIKLTVLPIANGRNTEAIVDRVGDYLRLHEVEPVWLPPVRPAALVAAIREAARDGDTDLLLLPAPTDGSNGRRANLTDIIMAVLQSWSNSVLIAS